MAFAHPWLLLLGILALLPLFRAGQKTLTYSWLPLLPPDPFSTAMDWLIRLIASGALAALVIALAGPYLREQPVERIGTGAHIVLLIDRSSSMNENFAGRYLGGGTHESKGAVARDLLAEFVARRKEDLFAMVSFSTSPIYVLPLTQDREAVQAAIKSAGRRGRGVTNIAAGLAMALDYFTDQPITGSRIILLVSDGAARIDEQTQDRLRQWFNDNQVMLYWIYLRNRNSVSLYQKPENPAEETTPEYFLHRYFQSLDVPYRAYEAENPEAVKQAIADVERLENQPIHYYETLPRKDLSTYCYTIAILLLLVLLMSRMLEVRSWHP